MNRKDFLLKTITLAISIILAGCNISLENNPFKLNTAAPNNDLAKKQAVEGTITRGNATRVVSDIFNTFSIYDKLSTDTVDNDANKMITNIRDYSPSGHVYKGTATCLFGGSAELTFIDKDGGASWSEGDAVQQQQNDCKPTLVSLGSSLTITSEYVNSDKRTVKMSGDDRNWEVTYQRTSTTQIVSQKGDGKHAVDYNDAMERETYSGNLKLIYNFANNTLSGAGTYTSSKYGEIQISFPTNNPATFDLAKIKNSVHFIGGTMKFRAKDGSNITATFNSGKANLSIDTNGDGVENSNDVYDITSYLLR